MPTHRTTYRVIYGDTDQMGMAYHANYLRWFEMGRTELLRHMGVAYRDMEERGVLLPVSEAYCKYLASARYDDMLAIETTLDPSVRAGMKFDYVIYRDADRKSLVKGYTKHACTTREGKVIRPPKFLIELIARFGGDA